MRPCYHRMTLSVPRLPVMQADAQPVSTSVGQRNGDFKEPMYSVQPAAQHLRIAMVVPVYH